MTNFNEKCISVGKIPFYIIRLFPTYKDTRKKDYNQDHEISTFLFIKMNGESDK